MRLFGDDLLQRCSLTSTLGNEKYKQHEGEKCDQENACHDRDELAHWFLDLGDPEYDRSNQRHGSRRNTAEECDVPQKGSHSK